DPRPITSVDRRRDAYQSHLRQFVAVDSVIGDLVNTIKSSGNWDSTMIVVTADHGLTFCQGFFL
ncbi:MAG: sulfatase-like hydrolase/transferase, partial [Micrococcales bacterium]